MMQFIRALLSTITDNFYNTEYMREEGGYE